MAEVKIYFKYGDTAESLEDLFRIGFRYDFFAETFKDKDLSIQECHSARRSFGDLCKIARTYFPDATDEEVAHIITTEYSSFFCPGIRKVIFLKETDKNLGEFHLRCGAEYNANLLGDDGYSYMNIKEKAKRFSTATVNITQNEKKEAAPIKKEKINTKKAKGKLTDD